MRDQLKTSIIYLITSGEATNQTFEADSKSILTLIETAVEAGVSLIQLREKNLSARSLYELAVRATALTSQSSTKLLINDRADIASASGAQGVHLTTRSLEPSVVRRAFGKEFLIGVSTHSLLEIQAARDNDADFAVFGPIFETPSKSDLGPPIGIEKLGIAAREVRPFPLIAIGGLTRNKIGRAHV